MLKVSFAIDPADGLAGRVAHPADFPMFQSNRKEPMPTDDGSSELSPESVAERALDEAGGNAAKATEIMVAAVRANPLLYRALMDPLVKNACYVAIRKECRRASVPVSQRRSV
jgi:hypothetical protein